MGGEKAVRSAQSVSLQGSPPRGRGKDPLCLCQPPGGGITPAWAGKSHIIHLLCVLVKDHPRVGGEKEQKTGNRCTVLGSPPRGRGKVDCPRLLPAGTRITPAWAGKSHERRRNKRPAKDHPRVGGEKRRNPSDERNHTGSPPRGRGKAKERFLVLCHDRITPAWAGKRA